MPVTQCNRPRESRSESSVVQLIGTENSRRQSKEAIGAI
jgi:hypothetical protein